MRADGCEGMWECTHAQAKPRSALSLPPPHPEGSGPIPLALPGWGSGGQRETPSLWAGGSAALAGVRAGGTQHPPAAGTPGARRGYGTARSSPQAARPVARGHPGTPPPTLQSVRQDLTEYSSDCKYFSSKRSNSSYFS